MAVSFADVTTVVIPQGDVSKITKTSNNLVLWEKYPVGNWTAYLYTRLKWVKDSGYFVGEYVPGRYRGNDVKADGGKTIKFDMGAMRLDWVQRAPKKKVTIPLLIHYYKGAPTYFDDDGTFGVTDNIALTGASLKTVLSGDVSATYSMVSPNTDKKSCTGYEITVTSRSHQEQLYSEPCSFVLDFSFSIYLSTDPTKPAHHRTYPANNPSGAIKVRFTGSFV